MKLIFAILCFALTASAQMPLRVTQDLQMAVAKPAEASLPIPDIIYEDFESGTAPAEFTSYSSPVWNSSPALLGNYSLRLTAASSFASAQFPTATNEFYFYSMFRMTNLPASLCQMSILLDNSASAQCYLYIETNGKLTLYDPPFGASATTTDAVTTNTTYYVWIYSKKGTGANQVASVAFSTSNTEPTAGTKFAKFTNGAATAAVKYVQLINQAGTGSFVFDHIGIATFDMPTGW